MGRRSNTQNQRIYPIENRMKTIGDSTLATLIGSKFGEAGVVETNVSAGGKIHRPLQETLPYWFAILSPVIGIFAGFGLAWWLG